MAFYETAGGIQERMFIDIDERGQVVGVDIIISGKQVCLVIFTCFLTSVSHGFKCTLTDVLIGAIGTPNLSELESCESIPPSFQTPQGSRVNVIHITWQVETKLTAWFARRKHSDFLDLVFLLTRYGHEIAKWSHS